MHSNQELKETVSKVKPLMKWAGGKRQILPHLMNNVPDEFSVYYEPFAGGAALLLELFNAGRLRRAVISDINTDLIELYSIVKNRCNDLIEELQNMRFKNTSYDYYRARDLYNSLDSNENPEKAALMIYLNRHAYNGLYRVNSTGKFNVPFGRYRNPSLPTSESIISFSNALKNVRIVNEDFESVVCEATGNDFVYFDPPYDPVSSSSNFDSYTSNGFGHDQQIRLSSVYRRLSERGTKVMESNSNSPLIDTLYRNYTILKIGARRSINSKSEGRGKIDELIIKNYTANHNPLNST
ncbi:MAG: DNA adenine methylase [Thermoplasmataceae archaeon]|jgi:DNA adenine methylase